VARHIGLTGGIGSGKSTVAKLLVQCGAVLVDTDAIAHATTAPQGAGISMIKEAFGVEMIDDLGALNRVRMRDLVFCQPDAKLKLENILHPLIGQEAQRQAQAAQGRPVVFDVPLLTESQHWRERVDRILVIDCEEATQVKRVMQRSGWTQAAVERVQELQATRRARRAIADAIIFNDGVDLNELRGHVLALWRHWF
jgi:dephospho-CoA kinase